MTKARQRAVPSRRPAPTPGRPAKNQVRALLHELQVNSEEITVQNEQLIKAQVEIELARDRYAELYDFAPLGYLSLDAHGAIHECNFAAAALLSRPRPFLLHVPLPALLITAHRPLLRQFLHDAMRKDHGTSTIEVQLKLVPTRTVRLFAQIRPGGSESRMLFTAIMDVTVEREIEAERREVLVREQERARELAGEVADRTRAETRVKTLLDRLVTVQEEERRRLSRELHDELGQQLTALRLTLSMLRQVAGNKETRRQLAIADAIAARLDHDVDTLAWALRPAELDEFGLVPALQTFVRQWSERYRIPAELTASETMPRLAIDVENHLYRTVQEALNNVVKHAEATHAAIRLTRFGRRVKLVVHDNGHGFDIVREKSAAGIGLLGMRERIALIGGDIEVDSSVERGTTITVTVPVAAT